MRPTSKSPPFPLFLQDLRVRYYNLLVTLHQARHDPLALFKDFTAVLATRGLADDAAQLSSVLSSVVLYLCLSPWDNEVSDAMHRLVGDKRLDPLPSHRALLKLFTTQELVPWPLPPALEVAVRAHPAFLLHPATGASASSPEEVDAVSDIVVSGVHGATASATTAAWPSPTNCACTATGTLKSSSMTSADCSAIISDSLTSAACTAACCLVPNSTAISPNCSMKASAASAAWA